MKIAFYTLGCKLNFAETSSLGKALLLRGHEKVGRGEEADVCVINTCSVTDTADHKDRQLIHRIRRQHPNAVLIVTGCYAQLKPHEVAAMPEVDYVLGMDEKFEIPEILAPLPSPLGGKLPLETCRVSAIREVDRFCGAVSKDDRTRCFLKVQDGCNYFCTYCTIPLARGKSRNGSIASLVKQAQEAIAGGAKEIVLTGVNIGDFGRTTGEKFIDLLKALDSLQSQEPRTKIQDKMGQTDEKIDGLVDRLYDALSSQETPCDDVSTFRYRISSCEPNLLTDEIIDFVAQSKHFAPHFHIPLQSGSDTVLRLMKRHYDTALFRERIEHIRQVMPEAFIGVDVMVGVRGETEEYFNEAVQFIERLDVSQLHVFTYSERANTKMLEIEPIVPQKERKRRSEVLHAVSERKLAAFYARNKGKKGTVLWESKVENQEPRAKSQDNATDAGQPMKMMAGFTENYIRVMRPYDRERVNRFEDVVIE